MTTEYGALIIKTGTVYLHGPLQFVQEFIANYGHVSPMALITRTRDGSVTGPWTGVPSINLTEERNSSDTASQREVV
jgi:hypothetical protein